MSEMTVEDLCIQLGEMLGRLQTIPSSIEVFAAEVRFQVWNSEDLATISEHLSIPVSVSENTEHVSIERWPDYDSSPSRLGLDIAYIDGMVA